MKGSASFKAVAETQTALAKIYLRGFPLSAARDSRVGTREKNIGNGTKRKNQQRGAGGSAYAPA